MTSLGPAWECFLRPSSVHHPAVGRQDVLAIHSGGVHGERLETVVVVGVDAEDGVVDIQ